MSPELPARQQMLDALCNKQMKVLASQYFEFDKEMAIEKADKSSRNFLKRDGLKNLVQNNCYQALMQSYIRLQRVASMLQE
jgi:hypothetical protein